ncbi:MAG: cyclic pyranopterin phosphate synthase [Verrucomicrobiales bacterium]|jgi:cyclic pyranopterin phosphate synthase
MRKELTHLAADGTIAMVDVSDKDIVSRTARARGFIHLQPETIRLITTDGVKKGNVLATARIAGIQAAKQTATLIPLCHQLPLRHVSVDFTEQADGFAITATAKTQAQTGVEMEALTAVSLAALTIYDMCKAVDTTMTITDITLVEKRKESLS